MDVDVHVIAADEAPVGQDPLPVRDDDRVAREIEAGHVPVGQQVVELEVGLPELRHVARDDEVRNGLRVVRAGRPRGQASVHERH
jgi:hypothetical protein